MKKNIYLCGPTVYSSPHIGNMRPIISFDIYNRTNKYLGNEINFIHNITDIDDKIILKSIKENVTEKVITNTYIREYKELLLNFNILFPNHMPLVTENIDLIIEFIQNLIGKKLAYESNGSVYFNISKFKNYGNLSGQDVNKINILENIEEKNNQLDFVVWKKSNKGINYDSPWSKGRPGWHTECAVLNNKYLNGESLDIHGAGIDLIFPHNENENAQYEAFFNKPISKEWKHLGKVEFNNEKMSKSKGNVILAIDFLEKFDADTLRILFLISNPTGPINLNKNLLEQSFIQKEKFKNVFIKAQLENESKINITKIANEFSNWKWANGLKLINKEIKTFNKNKNNATTIIEIMKLLGFNFSKNLLNNKDKKLFKKWNKLREKKKYEEADKIKKELLNKEII